MTAAPDFAKLPPEVNSARMYAGAGPASMVGAASAWKGLAAELRSAALSYGSVVTALSDEEWQGPASSAMVAAATPYVTWMNATAVLAEQTAAQAEGAVAAYEAAFSATVPPPLIATNRAQLASLVSTNVLGQNTPAIAVTEAQYIEMWAQDAAAMYGYAASSAAATRLIPFDPPRQNTNPAGQSVQSAAAGQATATSAGTGQNALSKLTSTTPSTLQSLASPSATTSLSSATGDLGGWNPFAPGSVSDTTGMNGLLNSLFGSDTAFGQFLNANIWNTIFSSGFYMPGNFIGTASDFIGLGQGAGSAAADAAEGVVGAAAGLAGVTVTAPAAGFGTAAASVTAGLASASQVGPLSVPAAWTAAAPQMPAPAATPMIAPPSAMAAGIPGIPLGGMSGRSFRNVPQYGFKPNFIARPPSAG